MRALTKINKSILSSLLVLIFICGPAMAADKQLSIGTGSATGTYYAIGAALAKLFNDHVKGIYAVGESTGGSVENMKIVSSGDADIGLANQMHFAMAIRGQSPFNKPITNLRTIFPLAGKNYVMKHGWQLVVLQNSKINSISDLKGKKVAVGPSGSGTEAYSKKILQSCGLTYDDIIPRFSSYTEGVMAMQDGNMDAMALHSAVPTGAVIELGSARKIRLISLEEDKINKAIDDWGFNRQVIPAGSYEWLKTDVTTVVAAHHVIFVSKEMDPELAYKLAKAAIEYKEELWPCNPAAKNYDEYGVETGLRVPPLHIGAMKYFKEIGIKIPDIAVPPEAK